MLESSATRNMTSPHIVDDFVEQTVGTFAGVAPEKSLALRILDPACGSGSFLIRAFERMCEAKKPLNNVTWKMK
jgi:type I restriction-modification system DNA methylase subunit